MDISIRDAKPEDAEAVLRLYQEFTDYRRSLGQPVEAEFTREAYLRDGFGARPAFYGLVAEADSAMIGYLSYQFVYDMDAATRGLYIMHLFVTQQARRCGAGRALMEAATHACKAAGGAVLVWEVYNPNQLAFKFYEGLEARPLSDITFMQLPV